jgi:5-methyltetrahydrofolate--homocysteine methyltransferase
MIVIGEKINSTLKAVRPAIESYDTETILKLAKDQYEAGASYLDVNAALFLKDEPERLEWLVKTIQEEIKDVSFAVDSPSPEAIERALKANKNKKPMINSLTAEKERFNSIAPLVTEYKTAIVALCMDDNGMPEDTDTRVSIAGRLINDLGQKGVPLDDIYIDPLVRPVGTGSHYGRVAIETIRKVKQEFPEVHIACGLSNVSFGLPARKLINQSFLVAAIAAGMDGAIIDPLDKKLMSFLYAAEALMGVDEFCVNYLEVFREGKLEL